MSDQDQDLNQETKRLEDAWTRLLAGEALPADERAALTGAAERDEVFRRRLIYDLQVDGALRAMGHLDSGQEAFLSAMKDLVRAAGHTDDVVAAVSRRIQDRKVQPAAAAPKRRSYVFGVGALVASAAMVVVLLWPHERTPAPDVAMAPSAAGGAPLPAASPRVNVGRGGNAPAAPARAESVRDPIARVETLAGRGYVHGADGSVRSAPELAVRPGDWVSTVGSASRARLVHTGGDRLELEGDVVAGMGAGAQAGRVFLAHGRALATLGSSQAAGAGAGAGDGSGGPGSGLIVASPHAIVSGSGTIRLQVTASATRVEVLQGRAHVAALGVQRATEVEAAQFATVRADDLQPPRAQAAVREALLLVGPDDTKEERPAPPALRGSEELMKVRLERLGFTVRAMEATTLSPEEASAAALLVLSPSVSVTLLPRSFGEQAVPMVLLESSAFTQFGLTGERWRRDLGPTIGLTDVIISNPQHPLAAGLTGTVRVLAAPRSLRWASPPAGAEDIVSFVNGTDHGSLVFGYERGAAMAVGTAAARRSGLFLGNGRVIRSLTEQGWQLFDAAVTWTAGR